MATHSETILRAAHLMEQRALAATASPWHARPIWSPDTDGTSAIYSHAHPAGSVESEVIASGRIRRGYGGTRNPHDAIHIAGMQPSFALAVAKFLERSGKELASTNERYGTCDEPAAIESAYAMAVAYLAEEATS
jgi:hypothetical protein